MKKQLCSLVMGLICIGLSAQTAVVSRNVNLRITASTNNDPIATLTPGTQIQLLEPGPKAGYYHVRTAEGRMGFVWSRNIRIREGTINHAEAEPSPAPVGAAASNAPTHGGSGHPTGGTSGPSPLLAKGHPVDWWFVFKFNSAAFPGCHAPATRSCLFGGTVQNYRFFSQQFVYASSEAKALQEGNTCAGDSTEDPVGATFEQVYDGSLFYVIWNDQFYDDPIIKGCTKSCGAPWGHSKGMVAWNDAGEGFVLQVTTPSWPAAGSSAAPRKSDGNTLGCVSDDNVEVSQHFFALKLTKDDLAKVIAALNNASVVTDPLNPQLVRNGGPAEVQSLVKNLGVKSPNTTFARAKLSSGVELISKPSHLNVPPWQMVSAILGGQPLRAATWWANPKISSTTSTTPLVCWSTSLGTSGAVEIATTGHWGTKEFGLTGGLGPNFNHAKIGVSTSTGQHLAIFGDMNQQGTVSGPNCASSQNGRGGLFYVVDDPELFGSVRDLISGGTAPPQ
jgi:hypothetical protein